MAVAYAIQEVADILKGKERFANSNATISYLCTDSRRIFFPLQSLFIALQTSRRDGHAFIQEVYDRGVRNFIVHPQFDFTAFPEGNFIKVSDTLEALQTLAAYRRTSFEYPVIGITGSNGKTIVKEWLYNLLSSDFNIVRSPRSYNSQVGVPLSVWQMDEESDLAIIEAGISRNGEMEKLEKIIHPTIGILTNIGEAHSEGFASREEKTLEKIQLFQHAQAIIYGADDILVQQVIETQQQASSDPTQLFSWGKSASATLQVLSVEKGTASTHIKALYQSTAISINIGFTDDASIQNAITCWCTMLYLQIAQQTIAERMLLLQPVDMRLQMMQAMNNCAIINDSYSFDITSFSVAIDFLLQQHQFANKTVIVSDLPENTPETEYTQVAQILNAGGINKVITIGNAWQQHKALLANATVEQFPNIETFLQKITANHFRNEAILLKGARVYMFERIVALLEKKVHQTVMQINLTALTNNLKLYQQQLRPGVKLMAMVKAFGYGSGSAEVANVLQFHKVDYLAVAYADEGIELRKAGISLPILILNVDEAAFETIVAYNLEPELFSFPVLQAFDKFLLQQGLQQYPVHIKLDTGMHRLGFEEKDMDALLPLLKGNQRMIVTSVFSHLAASDDPLENEFTLLQAKRFENCCAQIREAIGYDFIKHLSNSAAIATLHGLQYDMVRLGIGLYGVDSSNEHQLPLQTVATLQTTIAQLRRVKAGETIGYNRRGKVTKESLIATIRIGYADGFSRRLGNGAGKVWINGTLAPVIGSVCMDMTMIDVTDVPGITEKDEVEIFGPNLSVEEVAKMEGTIAYEVLTSVGQRVKRVYIEE